MAEILLPRLRPDDKRTFDETVEAYLEDPERMQSPPWVMARAIRANDPVLETDAHVAASVLAVYMVGTEAWLMRGYLRSEPAPAHLFRISVEPFPDPDREVTRTALKAAPLPAVRNRALAMLRFAPALVAARKTMGGQVTPDDERLAAEAETAAGRQRRRGGRSTDRNFYMWLANEYLGLIETGQPRPREELARRVQQRKGLAYLPPDSTIRSQLDRASNLLYLHGEQGKPYTAGPNLERKGANG